MILAGTWFSSGAIRFAIAPYAGLLINGGRAAALLAFLPQVLGKPGCEPLVLTILIGLLLFSFGLFAAVFHNHLRRRCSLIYGTQPPCQKKFLAFFKAIEGDPCICCWSWLWMWLSAAVFILAVIIIAIGGLIVL
jgi:hypothetical protein